MSTNRIFTLLHCVIGIMAITSGCDIVEEEMILREKEKAFSELVQVGDMNDSLIVKSSQDPTISSIRIELPSTEKTSNQDDDIPEIDEFFRLENHSTKDICFNKDFGIHLYYYDAKEEAWVEIKNKKLYFIDDSKKVLPNKSSVFNSSLLSISPELPAFLDDDTNVRVLAQGVFCGTDTSVAGFVDFDFTP